MVPHGNLCRNAIILSVAVASTVWSLSAYGAPRFADGRWRLELNGFNVVDSSQYGDDDRFMSGSVEYEFPATHHIALGLRLIPLFLFPSDGDLYGAGGGVSGRIYQRGNEYTGFFGELELSAFWHDKHFRDDSSDIDFITEGGIGYQFAKVPVHLTLKFEHISNAGIGDHNGGLNGAGLGFGFTF